MEENDLPIYELTIEDIDFDGMKAISIVEFPAIEEDFMKFSKEIKLGGGTVYKKVEPDACEHCVRCYGSRRSPKKFTYDELEANGTNKGRKPEQWLPVIGKTHPNCKCKLVTNSSFSSEDTLLHEVNLSKLDTEKRIITGPALIPEKLIYRNGNGRGEFNVKFSAETIEKLNINFFENFKQQSINMEHNTEVNNVTVIESWIVKNSDNDKATELGFDVPDGTWMVSMKVSNDMVWEKIKSGELKGFSIEALLSNHIIEQSLDQENETILNDIKQIINENKNVDIETFIDDIDDIIDNL